MRRRTPIAARVMLVLVALGTTSVSRSAQQAVSRLDSDHQPLATDFDAASGSARLLVVLSPT